MKQYNIGTAGWTMYTSLYWNPLLKQASSQWHIQRITAFMMLPLWLSLHCNVLSFLMTILPFHIHMGLLEIIEDYVHNDTAKEYCIWILRLWVLISVKVFLLSFFF